MQPLWKELTSGTLQVPVKDFSRGCNYFSYDALEYERPDGNALKSQKEVKSDQWEVIEFPAIMPSGEPVWPEYWKKDELDGVKASLSLGK